MVLLVFSTISTLEMFTLFVPIIVVTSPNIPGLSGKDIQRVVLYFFSVGLLSSLYCQYLLIAALALPVLALVIQCKEGESFFDVNILTTSPFRNIDCRGLSFPFISHPIAVSPTLV